MDFIMPMAFLCGFVMGFLICFTGVGGGVLIIPAIVYFFDLDVSVAIGTASVYATLTKIVAGVEHVRIGNVNFRLFTRLSIAAVPGVVTAAVAVNYLLTDDELGGMIQESLRLAVIAAIFLSLLFMLVQPKDGEPKSHADSRPAFVLPVCGVVIGLVMGATGIGGGVLIVPALLLAANETPKRIVGTSILTALALSALTALIYIGGGQTDWTLALWMSAGSLLAVPLGSLLLRRVSQTFVRRSLIALVLLAATLMIFKV